MIVGTVEVGAHTALLTLCVFIYMAVPFGIATAATIRVGNVSFHWSILFSRLQNQKLMGWTLSDALTCHISYFTP